MPSTSALTSMFVHWFRAWIRREPRRFRAYTRIREIAHWLRWSPYHARKAGRRGYDAVYWLPYRLMPACWSGTGYGLRAASGFPPAPTPGWLRQAIAAAGRAKLSHIGSFEPRRHGEAGIFARKSIVLLPPAEVAFAAPRVFGTPPVGWPAPWPDLSIRMGAITANEWIAARIVGRFDAVLLDRHCIVGDHWQRDTERTFDEVRGYARMKGSGIVYYGRKNPAMSVDRAIVVVGGPTVNWAHWTSEYLPKVALADSLEAYRDWPLVVDEDLHPNILASLKLVAAERDLIKLPEGTLMEIGSALTVGSPGYTAYEYRYDASKGPPKFKREHTVFSPVALEVVRSRAWAAVNATPRRERLIYVSRPKGSLRPFIGGEAVEAFFAAMGFEIVDTSTMDVQQQVRLFAQARCIAGPSGAGLTNLVFAPPGCRVMVFTSNSAHSIFHYFANMGAAVGHHVYYCYGEFLPDPGGHPGHVGFTISLETAREMWRSVVEDEPGIAS